MREYRDSDAEELLEVLRAAFGQWPQREITVPALDHLRWKLGSHRSARHMIVERDARIVAFSGMWVCPLETDGRSVLCRYSVDRAVVPEMQGLRVMTAMDAQMPKGLLGPFDVIVGVSNKWQSVNFVPGSRHHRIINVVTRDAYGDIDAREDLGWRSRTIDTFDERIDGLWRAASSTFRQATERTQHWLNYRFADPRAGNYRVRIAETGDEILGYIISSAFQGEGRIVDMLVRPGRHDVLVYLLLHAIADLRAIGCDQVECWRDLHHPYSAVMDELGFRPRRNLRITFHSQRTMNDLAFIDDSRVPVHFMAGDTDLA